MIKSIKRMTEILKHHEKFSIGELQFTEIPFMDFFQTLQDLKQKGRDVINVPTGSEAYTYDSKAVYTERASYCSAGIIILPETDERKIAVFHYRPIFSNTTTMPLLLRTDITSLGGIRGGDLSSRNEQNYLKLDLARIESPSSSVDFAVLVDPPQSLVLYTFVPYCDID
jgi:hypothetical protein